MPQLTNNFKLTKDNYYSEHHYMDVSTFKAFKACEAEKLAELKGEWTPDRDKTALLLGNFVHSYFESKESHQTFIESHKKTLYKYGNPEKGLKKDYVNAQKMIDVLDQDPVFRNIYMPGKKEVIVTGKIGGHDWKGKIDSLDLENGRFYDLKTTADIHKRFWDPDEHTNVPFVKAYGYYYQMVMYRELIRQTFGVDCTPFIFAVSKQQPYPDHDLLAFNEVKDTDWLEEAMQDILTNQDRYFDLINGKAKPERCGKCDYCRATKKITTWINASQIEVG